MEDTLNESSKMPSFEERKALVENKLKNYPDFPKPGILFRDIFPLAKDPVVFADLISLLTEHIEQNFQAVDAIVGLESRGFIFGPMMAQKLGVGFVPIRKKGKLPGECVSAAYDLEYGKDVFEIQKDSLTKGQKVVIIDDLLATGGTMAAAVKLMAKLDVEVLQCMVVIELADLKGREKIEQMWSLLSL